MVKSKQKSLEFEAFDYLQHWKPIHQIVSAEKIIDPEDPLFLLFDHIYTVTKEFYKQLPHRKNGENPFIHPLNVVLTLQRARADDAVTICAGLLHDYVEERVDLFRIKNKVKSDSEGIQKLHRYELELFKEVESKLSSFCHEKKLNCGFISELITLLKLLTHHKRHFYYQYICGILTYGDNEIKEKALQIKLADRMHNVLCIDCFSDEERLYQCFKNLFILNNTKQFLRKKYGPEVFTHKRYFATARLFNKCARSTYDGFLMICHLARLKGIDDVTSMLQLAFQKFALEMGGLWLVTKVDENQVHPFRLFQGVVRKYDARLHHEWDKYFQMKKKEMEYCRNFFSLYHFNEEQFQAILDYKDAFALREVIAYLLYKPDFVISKFLYTDLSSKGRIKKRAV